MPKTKQNKDTSIVPFEDELNPRWAKFIELYLESGNSYQSALGAGFADSYAVVIRSRWPDKVKKSLAEALEKRGITPDKIAEKVGWLLDQTDYQAVDKGITHAARVGVGGGYAAEKSVNLNVNVDMKQDPKALALAREYEEKLKQEIQGV